MAFKNERQDDDAATAAASERHYMYVYQLASSLEWILPCERGLGKKKKGFGDGVR